MGTGDRVRVECQYRYNEGAWSPWFWTFMIGIIPLAVAMTWIFNNTRQGDLTMAMEGR